MSGPPPEQVDPHLLGYGSLARDPDGWSAGLVTSLGRAMPVDRTLQVSTTVLNAYAYMVFFSSLWSVIGGREPTGP